MRSLLPLLATLLLAQPIAPASLSPPRARSRPVSRGGPRYWTLRVKQTFYCLRGTTYTGLQAGPHIVAVDPRLIPLHSRLWIPGYGLGLAEDTGSAVIGAHVDCWVPGYVEAMRDGVRWVTVSVYP